MNNIPNSGSLEHLHGAAKHEYALLLDALRQAVDTADRIKINTLAGVHATAAMEQRLNSEGVSSIASQVGVGRLATTAEAATPQEQRSVAHFNQADLAARAGALNMGRRIVADTQKTSVEQPIFGRQDEASVDQNDPVALARAAVEREFASASGGAGQV